MAGKMSEEERALREYAQGLPEADPWDRASLRRWTANPLLGAVGLVPIVGGAGMAQSALAGLTAPRRAMQGQISHEAMRDEAGNLAGLATGGAFAGRPASPSTLGMGYKGKLAGSMSDAEFFAGLDALAGKGGPVGKAGSGPTGKAKPKTVEETLAEIDKLLAEPTAKPKSVQEYGPDMFSDVPWDKNTKHIGVSEAGIAEIHDAQGNILEYPTPEQTASAVLKMNQGDPKAALHGLMSDYEKFKAANALEDVDIADFTAMKTALQKHMSGEKPLPKVHVVDEATGEYWHPESIGELWQAKYGEKPKAPVASEAPQASWASGIPEVAKKAAEKGLGIDIGSMMVPDPKAPGGKKSVYELDSDGLAALAHFVSGGNKKVALDSLVSTGSFFDPADGPVPAKFHKNLGQAYFKIKDDAGYFSALEHYLTPAEKTGIWDEVHSELGKPMLWGAPKPADVPSWAKPGAKKAAEDAAWEALGEPTYTKFDKGTGESVFKPVPGEAVLSHGFTPSGQLKGAPLAEEIMPAQFTSLPMDDAARMARAQAMGFDTGRVLYRGIQGMDAYSLDPETGLGFKSPAGKAHERAIFLADKPDISNKYVNSGMPGPMSFPLDGRAENPLIVDWNKATGHQGYAQAPMKEIIDNAWAAGHDMIELQNMYDLGGHQTQYLYKDPEQLRSIYAVFDPEYKHSNNLLRAAGLPLPQSDEARKKRRKKDEEGK